MRTTAIMLATGLAVATIAYANESTTARSEAAVLREVLTALRGVEMTESQTQAVSEAFCAAFPKVFEQVEPTGKTRAEMQAECTRFVILNFVQATVRQEKLKAAQARINAEIQADLGGIKQ